VKRTISEFLSSRQLKLGWGLPFHWGGGEVILAAILIFGILSLGSGMFGKWIDSAGDSWLASVTLHSFAEADYSVDEILRSVPAIGLDIIRDLLGITEPPEMGGVPETVLLTPGAPTPTPTLPFSDFLPGTATATELNPDNPTATNTPPASSTPSLIRTATPTSSPTDQTALPPTWTSSPPLLTNTPRPTSTPGNSSTNTPLPSSTPGNSATNTPVPTPIPPTATDPVPPTKTPLPAPTNPPNPTPTPQPQIPPTPRPTRSSTLAVTPTAKYTPGVTGEPPTTP
jgi:hypothetical protein